MPGEDELIQLRRDKLARLRSRGIDPYPPRVERTHTAAEAVAAYEAWEAAGSTGDAPDSSTGEPPTVSVTGRVTASRDMGKASFIDLRDGSGRIQCYVKKDIIGEDAYAGLADVDLGDFLAVSGRLMRTRAGEVTVEARSLAVKPRPWRQTVPPTVPQLFVGYPPVIRRLSTGTS